MARLKKSQRSLRSWTKQKWRTKSGKKSSETGERYLPEAAIKSLTATSALNLSLSAPEIGKSKALQA